MTKRELLEKLMGVAMDAQVVVVDATDYEDTEYEISEVVSCRCSKHRNQRGCIYEVIISYPFFSGVAERLPHFFCTCSCEFRFFLYFGI